MVRAAAYVLFAAFLLLSAKASGQDVDPLDPPDEMIQLAWRLPDGRVHLQYTYTAPNACWSTGDTHLMTPLGRRAEFRIVPQMTGDFCAMVMTPIRYSRDLELGLQFETILVVVEHPEGGVIEQSELWILSEDEAPE